MSSQASGSSTARAGDWGSGVEDVAALIRDALVLWDIDTPVSVELETVIVSDVRVRCEVSPRRWILQTGGERLGDSEQAYSSVLRLLGALQRAVA